MARRRLAACAGAMLMAAVWNLHAAQAPGAKIGIFTSGKGGNSIVKTETFVVQVELPPGAATPDTIQVKVKGPNGQEEPLTLKRKPGTNSYISEAASVAAGAQKTGLASYLPGNLSREMDPIATNNGDSISVEYTPATGPPVSVKTSVYDSATKQGIATMKAAIDILWNQQVRKAEVADEGLKVVEKMLTETTDPAKVKELQEAQRLFNDVKNTARTKLEVLHHALKQMNAPYMNDIMYPDQMRLAILTNYYNAALGGLAPGQRLGDLLFDAHWTARQQARRAWDDIQMQFWKDYTLGLYQAVATFSLAGPAFTLGSTAAAKINYYVYGEGTGEGLTMFNKAATSEDLLHAAKELAVAVALMKGLPAAVDVAGGKIAGEFGASFTGGVGAELAITGGGGAAASEVGRGGRGAGGGRGGAVAEVGGRGTAIGGGRVGGSPKLANLEAQAVADGAVEKSLLEGVKQRVEKAKEAGIPAEVVDGIVERGTALYEKASAGEPKINALVAMDLEIASEIFKLRHPGMLEVTPQVAEIMSSIKAKVALEVQGKAQTYTPEEAQYIQAVKNDPNLSKWVELDDPFLDAFKNSMTGEMTDSKIFENPDLLKGAIEIGYSPVFTEADIRNLKAAAEMNLKVQAQTIDPVIQAKLAEFRQAQLKAQLDAEQAAARAKMGGGNPAAAGYQTEILSPNDIKYVFTNKAPAGGELKPQFSLGQLRDQIVARRIQSQQKTAAAAESASAAAAKAFPNQVQLNAITPEQIRQMPPDMLAQLPVHKMSLAQVKAIAEAMGIPTGAQALTTTPATASAGAGAAGAAATADTTELEKVNETTRPAAGVTVEQAANGAFAREFGPNIPTETIPNPDGSVTVRSKDGKKKATARKGISEITGAYEYVMETFAEPEPGAADPDAPAGAISRHDYTAMDYDVRTTMRENGVNPDGWSFKPTNAERTAFTYTSPDGKTSVDAKWENGRMIVGQPYPTPPGANSAAPGSGAGPAANPGTGLGKDLCDRSKFWWDEARKQQEFADKATNPKQKAQFTESADWHAKNAARWERYAKENGYPCPEPTETTTTDGSTTGIPGGIFSPETMPGLFNVLPGGPPIDLSPTLPGPMIPTVQIIIITSDETDIGFQVGGPERFAPSPHVVAALAPGTRVTLEEIAQRPGKPMLNIVATGASTGEVFKVQVSSPTTSPLQVAAPDGLVLEAVQTKPAGPATGLTGSIEGYCLEFLKPPPAAGTQYRVASAAVQKKFAPMRNVLRAARKAAQDGLLHPDSDPTSYLQFVKQYALWTTLENWTPERFAEAFVDRTKKNFAALKRNWTKEVEQAVRGAIPNRWRDVQTVLQQAESLARSGGER